LLQKAAKYDVLVTHTPPHGFCDMQKDGTHEGSEAIANAIRQRAPSLCLCGHIHHSWGSIQQLDKTVVHNLGPKPCWHTVDKSKNALRVFEARRQLGGRIFSSCEHGSGPVEHGAEFVHGKSVRTWHYLRRYQIPTSPVPSVRGLRFVDENKLRHPLWRLMQPGVLKTLRATAALARYQGEDQSVASFLRSRGLDKDDAGWRLVQLQVNAVCASIESLGVTDAKAALLSAQSAGGNFRLTSGYSTLVNRLAHDLDIRSSQAVKSVQCTSNSVVVEANQQLHANCAIITLPLSILQNNIVHFDPALPVAKQEAINALAMHPAIKVLCQFKHPVGPANVHTIAGDREVPVFWRSAQAFCVT